jgi:type II secretory pathway component PulJ
MKTGARNKARGFSLIELMVYITVLMVVLGLGFAALYRLTDSSVTLRAGAQDIARALEIGERWREDVRSATGQPRVETTQSGQLLHLPSPGGEVLYRFSSNTLARRIGGGPWVPLCDGVKSSSMQSDPRQNVTAWRWELELKPRSRPAARDGRIRPLFTFIAVPSGSLTR